MFFDWLSCYQDFDYELPVISNTRTKPLNQGVNDQNDICTKVWNPILNDQKETLTGQL